MAFRVPRCLLYRGILARVIAFPRCLDNANCYLPRLSLSPLSPPSLWPPNGEIIPSGYGVDKFAWPDRCTLNFRRRSQRFRALKIETPRLDMRSIRNEMMADNASIIMLHPFDFTTLHPGFQASQHQSAICRRDRVMLGHCARIARIKMVYSRKNIISHLAESSKVSEDSAEDPAKKNIPSTTSLKLETFRLLLVTQVLFSIEISPSKRPFCFE